MGSGRGSRWIRGSGPTPPGSPPAPRQPFRGDSHEWQAGRPPRPGHGGSRGIGAAITELFAREGAAVAVCQHPDNSPDAFLARISARGLTVHAAGCDVADEDSVGRLADWAVD
ncbi:SDR family NAD(P)-dependent oxidoreductase, partial [Paracraurococcus lichenis]